jgi:glucosylceramidase
MKSILYSITLILLLPCHIHAQSKIKGQVYTTAKGTTMMMAKSELGTAEKAVQPFENEAAVFIDHMHSYQTIEGIGGALTDASAETFYKLPADQQKEFMKLYFDPTYGIGYSIGRTNINSCDFSSDMYTYITEGDKTLASWDISHDKKYKIPFIKEAVKQAGGKLKLFVSPWSPPAFMKSNNNMLQGGKLLPEFYDAYANYYIKFIKSYKDNGINVWGLTVQNEPMAKQTWESCIYTAEEELNFIKNHLGPTLHKNNMKDLKLIAWDHNRDLLYQRASHLLNDKVAQKYIWGIGFHWYEIWNGGRQYDNVKRVQEAFPATHLLLTEACNYPFSWQTFDDWVWGENYGENMIQDFNNGVVAWVDWNILLDEIGGPNHVGNYCFAPIHAKTAEKTIHKMNSYYYIGHFSKFVKPDAKRIAVSSNRAQLLCTGFVNKNGKTSVVVMNKTEEKIDYKLFVKDKMTKLTSLPHSIMTIVLD